MVDIKLSDLLGGTPMGTASVYNIYAQHDRTTAVERVVGENADDALARAKQLLGRDDLMVLRPHADEHVTIVPEPPVVTSPSAKADDAAKKA